MESWLTLPGKTSTLAWVAPAWLWTRLGAEVHDIPMSVVRRPIPSILDEAKVNYSHCFDGGAKHEHESRAWILALWPACCAIVPFPTPCGKIQLTHRTSCSTHVQQSCVPCRGSVVFWNYEIDSLIHSMQLSFAANLTNINH